mmetsp:Transcript_30347/g.56308  ORF Transcript_30347/g.56308 Transcript_30347/m.56308 type:complete len:238 (-) Transcript_30347:716-1429(-)
MAATYPGPISEVFQTVRTSSGGPSPPNWATSTSSRCCTCMETNSTGRYRTRLETSPRSSLCTCTIIFSREPSHPRWETWAFWRSCTLTEMTSRGRCQGRCAPCERKMTTTTKKKTVEAISPSSPATARGRLPSSFAPAAPSVIPLTQRLGHRPPALTPRQRPSRTPRCRPHPHPRSNRPLHPPPLRPPLLLHAAGRSRSPSSPTPPPLPTLPRHCLPITPNSSPSCPPPAPTGARLC